MQHEVHYLTAETPAGRDAIDEVMQRSYTADVSEVPPGWALVRLVDDVPVSFLLLDPDRVMDYPRGSLRYGFICDVATREDRRHEGHFRAIMEEAFARLRAADFGTVATHGRWALYRPLGFARFTHHSGIFVPVALIRRELGSAPYDGPDRLTTTIRYTVPDLLVVSQVRAQTIPECLDALRQAADLAQAAGRSRVLFEEPEAPTYGSRYPIRSTLNTPFVTIARALGASHIVMADDPDSGSVPDADSIKVLDTACLLRQVLPLLAPAEPLPSGAVAFTNDAGAATIVSQGDGVRVVDGEAAGVAVVRWPPQALAQLLTGYRPAPLLDALHGSGLPDAELGLLDALFPPYWRLTRNESWTYGP